MRMRSAATCVASAIALAIVGCASAPGIDGDPAAEVAALMAGQFDSREQAATDPAFRPIALAMVPIWPERDDGHWLYVEQAMADTPDQPYRQRVYRVSNGVDGEVASAVYTLSTPERFVQGWRNGALDALREDMLQPRTGCTVHLRRDGAMWQGATRGRDCASELRGAAYATAEVRLEAGRMASWDRGYAADGRQVWGSTAGPYVFVRRGPPR
jgi:CpeT protein